MRKGRIWHSMKPAPDHPPSPSKKGCSIVVKSLTDKHNKIKGPGHIGPRARFWPHSVGTKTVGTATHRNLVLSQSEAWSERLEGPQATVHMNIGIIWSSSFQFLNILRFVFQSSLKKIKETFVILPVTWKVYPVFQNVYQVSWTCFLKSLPSFLKSLPCFPKSLPSFPKSLPSFPKSLPSFLKSLPGFPKSLPNFPRLPLQENG